VLKWKIRGGGKYAFRFVMPYRCIISHDVCEHYTQVIRGEETALPCVQWHFNHCLVIRSLHGSNRNTE